MKIRVGHLYPDYLNIYADRGNIAVLSRARARARPRARRAGDRHAATRCRPARSTSSTSAAARTASRRSSRTTSRRRREPLREAVESGAAFLAVCGGYQLLGRFYRDVAGDGAARDRAAAAAHGRGRAADDRRRAARLRVGRRDARRLREPRRPDDPRRRAPSRSAASSRASATTARRASRAAATSASTAPTCTARCCRATRGSPTGCSPRRSRTPGGRGALRRRSPDELEREAHAVSAARARARGGRVLARPERAEVHGRVARLPALEEPLDRRVDDDRPRARRSRRAARPSPRRPASRRPRASGARGRPRR